MPTPSRIVVDFLADEDSGELDASLARFPFYNPELTPEQRLRLLPDVVTLGQAPRWILRSKGRKMVFNFIVYFLRKARTSVEGVEEHLGNDGLLFIRQFERYVRTTGVSSGN